MEIGFKLKEFRNSLGYSQEYVAEKISVSRQTISNWENEKTLPDIYSVILLSDLYDVSLDYLLKGDLIMTNKIKNDVQESKKMKKYLVALLIATILLVINNFLITSVSAHNFILGLCISVIVVSGIFTVKNLKNKNKEDN